MKLLFGFVIGVYVGQSFQKDELNKFGGFVYRDVSRRIQEIVDDGKK
jgi:hypothetical protein